VGFPSPADDYIESSISLNDYLVSHKEATYYVRVEGDSMQGQGIFNGDILVVDRSLPIVSGAIVIAVIDGEFTVKQLIIKNGQYTLHTANENYPDIIIRAEQAFEIWGVVKFSIHKFTL
jgi:DNA polymerase V